MRKRAGVGAIQKKKADAEKFRAVFKRYLFCLSVLNACELGSATMTDVVRTIFSHEY